MNNLLTQITKYCLKNKTQILNFISKIVKIKSYSNCERNISKFIVTYIKKHSQNKNLYIKTVKNNIIIFIGYKNRLTTPDILFDAHIDTVPAENPSQWTYPPFSGKILNNKIYGRGSCDDKASVTALVFTALFLAEQNYHSNTIAFSLSTNEENSSGKGIEQVLSFVKPRYCVICEPSNLSIIYGHKGKWSVKILFYGKPAHSAVPHLGKNAIYYAYPVIKNIIERKNNNFVLSSLGEPTYTITYIESKTNSLNTLPYECSLYIDYRSVIGETEKTVKQFLLQNLNPKIYKFIPLHRFFHAWILDKNNKLISIVSKVYTECFKKPPRLLLWQFCTNGSITMAQHHIPTIGFGPGNPLLAHKNNEYVNINDILEAIKFYSLLCYQI
ncbi:MAG: M20/M25/M40 family metallo-hydrolase [Endomicrobia bacterium]|nr:M20/M25/M40 family metallo-hydrolase [Endomicrobiia bacterium]MCX7716523.1 M20/M25/M40 family metallo-hydrolase [Endomicrobiia bacterium]